MVTDFEMRVMRTTVRYVCLLFNTSEEELRSVRRMRSLSDGRAVCMAIMVSFTGMSLESIGACFNRDHSTCTAAVKKVIDLRDTNHDFRARLKVVLDYVNAECDSSFGLDGIMERRSVMPDDNELFLMVCERDKKLEELYCCYNDEATLLLVNSLRELDKRIKERINYLSNKPI